MSTITSTKPASEKQLYWVKKVIADKSVKIEDHFDGNLYERAFDIVTDSGKFVSGQEAGQLLDVLFNLPYPKPASALTEPGMYRVGDDIFRVQWNATETNLYAKKLVTTYVVSLVKGKPNKFKGELVYAASAHRIEGLNSDKRMTKEEAIAAGKGYAICIVCGAELEDPKSVARGIGPSCAKKV